MKLTVDWEVRGTSTVCVSEAEMLKWDIEPDAFDTDLDLFLALDRACGYDLSMELVSDYDERDRPTILDVMRYSD